MRSSLSVLGPFLALLVFFGVHGSASAQGQPKNHRPNPVPYSYDELKFQTVSMPAAAVYLDKIGRFWMADSCGTCHANYTYLMTRPLLWETPDSAIAETRRFLEARLEIGRRALANRRNTPEFFFDSESVGIAFALATHDAQTTGRLRDSTRQALDQMWQFQLKQGVRAGTWSCGCGEFPPAELDRYYVATLGMLAASLAPEGYASSPQARDGMTRIRRFFSVNQPPHLHHRAMLLWASTRVDGLMTTAEQQAVVRDLLARQQPEGGWSLQGLLRPLPTGAVSDGYGTGFVVWVLRQAGVPANRPEIVRGINWLKQNQQTSGGWFTYSEHAGHRPEGGHGTRELSVLYAGASFAVLALRSCEDGPFPVLGRRAPSNRFPGLALRDDLLGLR
jgi:squalene-hopene/tetraprenyl-beta-curcumene cyclase